MKKFKINTVKKEWNEYGPGIAYVITVKELINLLHKDKEEEKLMNAPTNRDPQTSPWAKGSIYTVIRNLVFAMRKIKKVHPDFIGQITSMNVIVTEDGKVYITDGGHRAEFFENISDPEYIFPALAKGEVKDCEFLLNWVGKPVKEIKKRYPLEWEELMNASMLISTVSNDGLIQQGNNSGRNMNGVEKAYAMVKDEKVYQAIEDLYTVGAPNASDHANLNIGPNKGDSVRVKANNVFWIASLLRGHGYEKSGIAMRNMVERYDDKSISESFDRLFTVLEREKFDDIKTISKNGNISYSCNGVHGIIDYARIKTLGKKDATDLLKQIGDDLTTKTKELAAREKLADDILSYIEKYGKQIASKVKKAKKLYGEDFIAKSGAGHPNGGAKLCKHLLSL